jgi:hypothetical protein
VCYDEIHDDGMKWDFQRRHRVERFIRLVSVNLIEKTL